LGQKTATNEDEDLDENSSDAEIKKKSKARMANNRAHSAFTLICSEAKSFRTVEHSKYN
jgi:hypothetical protein